MRSFPVKFGTAVFPEAVGKGGDINIRAGSLSVGNTAALVSDTFGRGNAGDIVIEADNTISLDGMSSNTLETGISSSVQARLSLLLIHQLQPLVRVGIGQFSALHRNQIINR